MKMNKLVKLFVVIFMVLLLFFGIVNVEGKIILVSVKKVDDKVILYKIIVIVDFDKFKIL